MTLQKPLPEASQKPYPDGQRLDNWVLLETIGHGGMGVVWRAINPALHQLVAIKIVHPKAWNNPERLKSSLDLWKREALITSRLSEIVRRRAKRIDFITRVWDSRETTTTPRLPFMVMDLLKGLNAAQYIDVYDDRKAAPPLHEALVLARELATRVAIIHECHVIHGDIKPDNVFINDLPPESPDSIMMLMDFGLAHVLEPLDGLEIENNVSGATARYQSPEQVRGRPPTKASDVYSTGMCFYELVTARSPFDSTDDPLTDRRALEHAHLYWPVEAMAKLRDGVPVWFDELVLSMLEKSPADRPTMADVAAKLSENVHDNPNGTIANIMASIGPSIHRHVGPVAPEPIALPASQDPANDGLPYGDSGEWSAHAGSAKPEDEPFDSRKTQRWINRPIRPLSLAELSLAPPPVISEHSGKLADASRNVTAKLGSWGPNISLVPSQSPSIVAPPQEMVIVPATSGAPATDAVSVLKQSPSAPAAPLIVEPQSLPTVSQATSTAGRELDPAPVLPLPQERVATPALEVEPSRNPDVSTNVSSILPGRVLSVGPAPSDPLAAVHIAPTVQPTTADSSPASRGEAGRGAPSAPDSSLDDEGDPNESDSTFLSSPFEELHSEPPPTGTRYDRQAHVAFLDDVYSESPLRDVHYEPGARHPLSSDDWLDFQPDPVRRSPSLRPHASSVGGTSQSVDNYPPSDAPANALRVAHRRSRLEGTPLRAAGLALVASIGIVAFFGTALSRSASLSSLNTPRAVADDRSAANVAATAAPLAVASHPPPETMPVPPVAPPVSSVAPNQAPAPAAPVAPSGAAKPPRLKPTAPARPQATHSQTFDDYDMPIKDLPSLAPASTVDAGPVADARKRMMDLVREYETDERAQTVKANPPPSSSAPLVPPSSQIYR